WSVDPRDWESRDTEKVVRAVADAVQPGSIVLLHDIYPTSVEAALRLMDALSADGYQFVTVEELLRQNGVTPRAGVAYRSAGE
ncbi:MAG: hydrolase, partial [Oscillibacter sp.]|nr:hydrolase [Oscillibacter sp.]